MASDLANMVAMGGNQGVMMDPEMAAISPQMQLAQMMSQQSLSTAPAYPMQAAARLAQALAGVKIGQDVQQNLAQFGGQTDAAIQKIYPADTPIGSLSRSDSPMARLMARQAFAKSLVLNSEFKGMKPDETLTMPTIPRQGGSPVASGSPDLAAAVAGAKAKAEADYKEGGDRVIRGPGGQLQTIPMTAADRLQQSSAIPIVPKPVQTVPAPSRPAVAETGAAPGAPKVPDRVPALPSTAPMSGAQSDQPASVADRLAAAGIMGQPVKTPEYQGDVKGREELYGAANKAIGGVIAEHIEAGGKVARDKLNALDSIESAVRAFGPNVVTGPHAEFALRAKEALNGVGLNADWIDKGLPEAEIVTKMNAQLASASAKAMTGRPTQFEFASWQKNNPGLLTSKQGTLALTDILRQQTQNDIDLGKLAQQKNNWANWPDVADKFYESHGLTNPLTGKPMRAELAAARAGGGASQGAAPVRVATPDEARKLPKGTPILLPDGTRGMVP